MGANKSKGVWVLVIHCLVYSWLLVGVSFFLFTDWWEFVLVNGGSHFCVDFVTSRVTSHLHKRGLIYGFFLVIGLDQLIHTIILVVTAGIFQ